MLDVFISYVKADRAVALELSEGLDAAGFSTWCSERHSVPDPSSLIQTGQAIEECRAFLILLSRDSLDSSQIHKEVVRAHETAKPFIPVLRLVSHAEIQARRPEWRQAMGGATSIVLSDAGVEAILPRIVRGLQMMRIEPGKAAAESLPVVTFGSESREASMAPGLENLTPRTPPAPESQLPPRPSAAVASFPSTARRHILTLSVSVAAALAGATGALLWARPWTSESPVIRKSSSVTDQPIALPSPAEPSKPAAPAESWQASGTLELTAKIAGIQVFVGDRAVGEIMPGRVLVISDLGIGAHRVKARKTGHRDWEREVLITARRQRLALSIELDESPPVITGRDGAEMVLVPAGEFLRGVSAAEWRDIGRQCRQLNDEKECSGFPAEPPFPRRRISLDAFYIDRLEVTTALFERFVNATGHRTTAERKGEGEVAKEGKKIAGASWRTPTGPGQRADPRHPVTQVSWHDAEAYCTWADKRLPLEAEWEKAARGTDGRKYPWGNQWDPARLKVLKEDDLRVAPVGSFRAGASPYGVHDIVGNAGEWMANWYEPPPGRSQEFDERKEKVIRGVVFGRMGDLNFDAILARGVIPLSRAPEEGVNILGFRCAQDASGPMGSLAPSNDR